MINSINPVKKGSMTSKTKVGNKVKIKTTNPLIKD